MSSGQLTLVSLVICNLFLISYGVFQLVIFQFLHVTALYAIVHICYRPSVCLSVCPSVCLSHGWISQKRLRLGSCNFTTGQPHDSSFQMLNLAAKFQREHRERGRQIRQGYDKQAISANNSFHLNLFAWRRHRWPAMPQCVTTCKAVAR